MTYIVKQGCGQDFLTKLTEFPEFGSFSSVPLLEYVEHSLRDMANTKAVGPSAVLGSGVSQTTQSQLTDAAQSLKSWLLDQIKKQLAFLALKYDQVVDWIPKDLLKLHAAFQVAGSHPRA